MMSLPTIHTEQDLNSRIVFLSRLIINLTLYLESSKFECSLESDQDESGSVEGSKLPKAYEYHLGHEQNKHPITHSVLGKGSGYTLRHLTTMMDNRNYAIQVIFPEAVTIYAIILTVSS